MKISFCTTCMGRLHHLKETLLKNIEDNSGYKDLEFVVLDYNSVDGMGEWVSKSLSSYLDSGKVIYYREPEARTFSGPRAQNIAHGMATGDILCNVDADNFTGAGYASRLNEIFSETRKCFVACEESVETLDLFGRIAVLREEFHRIRGYDEAMAGWGLYDDDFKIRSGKVGLRPVRITMPGQGVIRHSDEERACLTGVKSKWESRDANRKVMEERDSEVVNRNGYGVGVVYRNFSKTPIDSGWGVQTA